MRLMRLWLAACLSSGLLGTAPAAAGELALTIPGGQFSVPVRSFAELRFWHVVKQRYDFSCGSAAVATLLTYHYGREVDEQTAFNDMFAHGDQQKIKSQGFSMLDMKRYLKASGLEADGYRIPLDRLRKLGLPAITLINAGGYRHFVVVKGVRDSEVLIGDPALGLRVMPRHEFEANWNGILFVIHSGPRVAGAAFNLGADWAARPPAPLREAVNRSALASFTLSLPRRGEF